MRKAPNTQFNVRTYLTRMVLASEKKLAKTATNVRLAEKHLSTLEENARKLKEAERLIGEVGVSGD